MQTTVQVKQKIYTILTKKELTNKDKKHRITTNKGVYKKRE